MRGFSGDLYTILDDAPQYKGKWQGELQSERDRVLDALGSTEATIPWRLVGSWREAQETIANFAAGTQEQQRGVSWGRYFAFDVGTGHVAPAKFAGIFGMTFEDYVSDRASDETVFDGHRTQQALEAVSIDVNSQEALAALRGLAQQLGRSMPTDPKVFVVGRPVRHFCLLASTGIYDVAAASKAIRDDVWKLPSGNVEPGDKLAFWRTLDSRGRRGIVAFGEVTAPAAVIECPEHALRFWKADDPPQGPERTHFFPLSLRSRTAAVAR